MPGPNFDHLKLLKDYSRPCISFCLAQLPKSDRTFVGGSDFQVYDGDLTPLKYEPKPIYKHESYVTSLAVVGSTLISSGYDGKLTWFDTQANKVLRTVAAHGKWIRKLAASPDGQFVASVADDMLGKVWNVQTGELVLTLKGHEEKTPNDFNSMLYAVAYSADGQHIATGDKTGKVFVWDAKTGLVVSELEAPTMYTWDPTQRRHSIGGIRSLAFSPDGALLAVGGTGKIGNIDHLEAKARVEVFDWKAAKRLHEITSTKALGLVNKLIYAPDGSYLLAAGGAGEGFLLVLDPTGSRLIREEKVNSHLHDAILHATAGVILSAGHSRVYLHKF